MAETNDNQPATKADLKELATKADLRELAQMTKADLDTGLKLAKSELRSEMQDMKAELKGDIAGLRTELKGDIKNLSGEILKIHFRMDRIEDTINTKVAMKDDLNRLFNVLDSISGDIKRYQREDTLRGDAVMRHEKELSNHENRIALLETKK